jgi:hypothetical protein
MLCHNCSRYSTPNPMEPQASPKFSIGQKIRVRPGVLNSSHPDICMEGWVGTIVEVMSSAPEGYAIAWSQETVDCLPATIRAGYESWACDNWMLEDELILDSGEPALIVPFVPAELTTVPAEAASPSTRPLSWDIQEDRIRAALGVSAGDPLPKVGVESLRIYADYLRNSISFNFGFFAAELPCEDGSCTDTVYVDGILGEEWIDEFSGVVCYTYSCSFDTIPMSKLTLPEDDPNYELLNDYQHWFRNWRWSMSAGKWIGRFARQTTRMSGW